MRPIKFRGKTNSGKWIYSDSIRQADIPSTHGAIKVAQLWEEGEGWVCVAPATVGQFTGLYDINGKEIYEGDILTFVTDRGKYIGVVKWGDTAAAWCYYVYYNTVEERPDYYYDYGIDFMTMNPYREHEIIGNIYDNPELLEVEE